MSGVAVDILSPYVFGAALILLRLGVASVFLPVLGGSQTPVTVRLFVVLFTTVAIDLGLGGVRVDLPASVLITASMAATEGIIGAGVGLAVRLVFGAVEAAGAIAATSMGLSMDMLIDPSSGEENSTVALLLSVTSSLVFLAVDGLHIVMTALFELFVQMPPGGAGYSLPTLDMLVEAVGHLSRSAVILAAPPMVVGLVVNVGIAFASRVVPSLNVFAVSLGLLTACGLLSLGLAGDSLVHFITREVAELPAWVFRLSGAPERL
jgi:flagellar biosynthetic protein FliR